MQDLYESFTEYLNMPKMCMVFMNDLLFKKCILQAV